MIARGAGRRLRRTLGTAVFSGMLGVTLFGIFLTPVFFFTVDWLSESRCSLRRGCNAWVALGIDLLTLRPMWKTGGVVAPGRRGNHPPAGAAKTPPIQTLRPR